MGILRPNQTGGDTKRQQKQQNVNGVANHLNQTVEVDHENTAVTPAKTKHTEKEKNKNH